MILSTLIINTLIISTIMIMVSDCTHFHNLRLHTGKLGGIF